MGIRGWVKRNIVQGRFCEKVIRNPRFAANGVTNWRW